MGRQFVEHIDRSGTMTLDPGVERPECACCDKPAMHFVNWRSGPMRGTDIDTFYVCHRHYDMAQNNQDRFFAHMRTKKKWLNRKNGTSR